MRAAVRSPSGAVLIFLTGSREISALFHRLRAHPAFGDAKRFRLVPLHASLHNDAQALAFARPPPGVRKLVLATNIAETGITIDDITVVIDCVKAKQTHYSESLGIRSLKEEPISNVSWLRSRN